MVHINASNYFEIIEKAGLNNLTQELIDDFHYIDESTESNTNWEYYKNTGSVRDAIIAMFADLENYLHENPHLLKGATKSARSKPATKKVAAKKQKAATGVKPDSKPKKVAHIKEEVKLIKRFVAFHNKVKTPEQILALLKSLQRSISMKLISKSSPYVTEIRSIQDKLVYLYNNYKPNKIEINQKELPRFVAIAGGEQVYPSINFMKRFISYQGKQLDNQTKERFLNQLKKAAQKKAIVESDPYADKLKWMYEYLMKQYKAGSKVSLTTTELNGLDGIVCSCQKHRKELGKLYDSKGKPLRRCRSAKYSDARRGACSYNGGIAPLGKLYDTKGKVVRRCKSSKYSDAKRGACSYNGGLSGLDGVMTPEQISNKHYELLPFTGQWETLLGKPEKNFTMMIHGEPGGGKTVFLMQFVKYLCQFGKGLYVSSEEHGSFTLKEKIDKYLIPFPQNLHFISHLSEMDLDNYNYSFAVFDSINDLGMNLEYFKELKRRNPNTAFVLVLQNTKDGQFRGGKEWEHEVQIVGKVEKGLISIYKNRYNVYGSWQFSDYSE